LDEIDAGLEGKKADKSQLVDLETKMAGTFMTKQEFEAFVESYN
jgi:hypothetical protein